MEHLAAAPLAQRIHIPGLLLEGASGDAIIVVDGDRNAQACSSLEVKVFLDLDDDANIGPGRRLNGAGNQMGADIVLLVHHLRRRAVILALTQADTEAFAGIRHGCGDASEIYCCRWG